MAQRIDQLLPDLPQAAECPKGASQTAGATDLPARRGTSSTPPMEAAPAMLTVEHLTELVTVANRAESDDALLSWDTPTVVAVMATAGRRLPPLAPCQPDDLAKILLAMMETLPRKAADDDGGRLKMAVYSRMLGQYPLEQLKWLAEQAIATCRFFPSVAECRAILNQWQRRDDAVQAQAMARSLWNRRRLAAQRRHDADLLAMEQGRISDEALAAVPAVTRMAALALGYIEKVDGTFRLRGRPNAGEAA